MTPTADEAGASETEIARFGDQAPREESRDLSCDVGRVEVRFAIWILLAISTWLKSWMIVAKRRPVSPENKTGSLDVTEYTKIEPKS